MFFTLNYVQSFLQKLRSGTLPAEREQKKFLRDTANLFVTDLAGDTALHLALKRGFEELAVSLIEAGAGVNMAGEGGISPLALAVGGSLDRVARLLIERGAVVAQAGINSGCEDELPLH